MKSLAELFEVCLAAAREIPDEVFEKRARESRIAESRAILGRMPMYLRTPAGDALLARVRGADLVSAAKGWQRGTGGLLLMGQTRVGKSSACGWLYRRLVHDGVKLGGVDWRFAQCLQWFSATELERARREHPLGRGDAPEISAASSASLLVLDDCGWERDPAAVSGVLNERYELGRPTAVNSGKTREQLVEHYGEAVVRRIIESGGKRARVIDMHRKAA